MVIVQSEYQCARSQFNESHLWHICAFIPLQGETLLPKQSLHRVEGCGSCWLTNPNSVPKMAAHQPIDPPGAWEHTVCMRNLYLCTFPGLNVVLSKQAREGLWNVRASCLGQETLWHVKGISQTWVHRMINSTANLSTNCIHTNILKDYWTTHLWLFHELSIAPISLAADISWSFSSGI